MRDASRLLALAALLSLQPCTVAVHGGGARVVARRPPTVMRASAASSKGFGAPAKRAPKRAAERPPPRPAAAQVRRVRKGQLSPMRVVPAHIPRPDYAATGSPGYRRPVIPWDIEAKGPEAIAGMRAACALARDVLDAAGKAIAPGLRLDEIDRIVHEETIARGAYPSTLNYHGYPKSVCTSVNEIVCHGIPDDNVLHEGDIVNVDVTCYYGGYHGDLSETFAVGRVDAQGRRLVRVTHDAWQAAIAICAPGVPYKAIGAAIEEVVAPSGFSIVRGFVGHGIGHAFHMPPNVVHHRNDDRNGEMAVGHTFTIEPMVNERAVAVTEWDDKWTIATADGGRSAQFEHTLLIVPGGVEVLTLRTPNSQPAWWEEL
ncbi:hypothetical protein KFE25_012622 [Diacronema lutheri]|uniref:Methionine aminopeptidase n=1 Tax=Diacronema lutheri TaxID=2081491 RepID=A0A8J5XRH8_DIALT|nr:hypothetical protein KFE25_012622 [Diacronema lutheri]